MSVDRRTVWPYDEHGEPGAFVYQRYSHPTGTAAEEALGALEGGDALLFSSHRRRDRLRLRARRPGRDRAGGGRYFGTGVTFAQFAPWTEGGQYDQTGPPADADVWVEAPANPF
jgi:hypothetical protein